MSNRNQLVIYGDAHGGQAVSLSGVYTVPMPTAIFMVYTYEGFVAASDGRGNRNDGLQSEREQKIFPIKSSSWNLVFGLSGAASLLENKTGEDIFKKIYQNTIEKLSAQDFADLSRYVDTFICVAGNELHPHFQTEFSMRTIPTSYDIRMIFGGYFKGRPSMSERTVTFNRDTLRITKQRDIVPTDGSEHCIFGSEKVTSALLTTDDYSEFETLGFRKIQMRDSSLSLQEAVEAAKKYIEACSTEKARELDDYCKCIGGRMSIGVLTPSNGLEWVEPPWDLA